MRSRLRHLDQELEKLKNMLLAMSALVEAAVSRSITALVQTDRKLAEEVLHSERRVNRIEIAIDDQAVRLLALRQPMACDLRLIASAIKINTQLERSVLASDGEVDQLRTTFFGELTGFMQRQPENIPQGLSLLMVVRNLERIAPCSRTHVGSGRVVPKLLGKVCEDAGPFALARQPACGTVLAAATTSGCEVRDCH